MSLNTYVCSQCGEQFDAHDSAETAQLGYCSQQCMNAMRP